MGDLGELGYEDPGPEPSPGAHDEIYRKLSMVGIVLAIPITLIVVTEMGLMTFSFVLLLLVKSSQARPTYRPHVKLEPKYNAALLIHKAKTGMSISEITEMALKKYFSEISK